MASHLTFFRYYLLYTPIILLHLLPSTTNAANMLAVLPSVWKSHYLFGRRLLQQLVTQQNYSVTIISPHAAVDDGIEILPNIREIRIDGLMENWLEMGMSFDVEHMRVQSIMERFTRLTYASTANVELLLSDAQVRKLLSSGERFDLLLVDLFLNDALLGLAQYYDVPAVAISPTGANSWLNHMLGNPENSALDPSYFLPYTERMNMWQRIVNTLMCLFERMTYNFFHVISQQIVYMKHFEPLAQKTQKFVSLPYYRELTKNLSLALLNTHPVLHYPRAYLPNMLEIGGAHLHAAEQLSLPNHLKEFIESANSGIIYMSLGANMRIADLPREQLEMFLDVFAYLKEFKFLLKWEHTHFELDLPANVMINSWFPQEALLAHAHVKVFISSCGLLSVMEAIAGHTPILAIPILPEQEVMAMRLQQQSVALTVAYDAISYDALLFAIQELTINSSYERNMQRMHALLKTGAIANIDKAVYFIDLTLKTSGADHLKTYANKYNFWRAELVDVLAIITLGLGCILIIPFLVICCILRKSYYSQQAATVRQHIAQSNIVNSGGGGGGSDNGNSNSNYHITLKTAGHGCSCGGKKLKNKINYAEIGVDSTAGAAVAIKPLRRTRSAYSLSTPESTAATKPTVAAAK